MSSFAKKDGTHRDYHDKWAKVANDEVALAEAEDEAAKAEAAEAVGLTAPRSEAEAVDASKHAQLKAAKKKFDLTRKDLEAKAVVLGETGVRRTIGDDDPAFAAAALPAGKPAAVLIKGATGCTYTVALGPGRRLVKLFLEGCTDCTVAVACDVVTQHVEATRCVDLTVAVRAPLATLQADLCTRLRARYALGALAGAEDGTVRVYHAASGAVDVMCGSAEDAAASANADAVMAAAAATDDLEAQFVTAWSDGRWVTQRAVRPQGYAVPVTQADIERDEAAKLAESGAGSSDAAASEAKARAASKAAKAEALPNAAAAADSKAAGNSAFVRKEYSQAAVDYTLAVEHAAAAPELAELKATCLSNRAACFLKLGNPEKAIEDCKASIDLDASKIKAHFRAGLALHMLEKFKEALPYLAKAHDMEPKNKAVKEALTFAEMRLAKQMRARGLS